MCVCDAPSLNMEVTAMAPVGLCRWPRLMGRISRLRSYTGVARSTGLRAMPGAGPACTTVCVSYVPSLVSTPNPLTPAS